MHWFGNTFKYIFHASCPTHKVGAGFLPAVWLEDIGFHLDLGLSSFWACEKLSSQAAPSHQEQGCACVSVVQRVSRVTVKKKKGNKKKKTGCSLLSVSSCCSLSCAVRAPFWQVLRLSSEVSTGLGWEPTLPLLTAAVFSHCVVTSALWLLKNV